MGPPLSYLKCGVHSPPLWKYSGAKPVLEPVDRWLRKKNQRTATSNEQPRRLSAKVRHWEIVAVLENSGALCCRPANALFILGGSWDPSKYKGNAPRERISLRHVTVLSPSTQSVLYYLYHGYLTFYFTVRLSWARIGTKAVAKLHEIYPWAIVEGPLEREREHMGT